MQLVVGDKAPAFVGATASGRFFSLDAQAGRPALIVSLGALDGCAAQAAFQTLLLAMPKLATAGIDVIPITSMAAGLAFASAPEAADTMVYVTGAGGLETLSADGKPAVLAIDGAGRSVGLFVLDSAEQLLQRAAALAPCFARDAGRVCRAAAPVLFIPNVASPELCEALIAHFEASPHEAGRMAAVVGASGDKNKLDEQIKHRRDMELTPDSPLHGEVLNILSARVVPEIKKAFQKDVGYADRILIARYDDTGGYFKRHRDNALPHTAFREFAVSLNLNTHAYEGGELRFPEYDDNAYSPPAGAAGVFSASVLHEAAAVTKGSRYVALTFLSSTPGQA
jgi:predicted 2-oxoglutarate/Fe(II)-dependent dioxygenase YbiX